MNTTQKDIEIIQAKDLQARAFAKTLAPKTEEEIYSFLRIVGESDHAFSQLIFNYIFEILYPETVEMIRQGMETK